MHDWWFDERRHAGDEHLDADFVAGYDRKQQFDPRPDVARLVELGLGPGSTLVDLGCGTGTFAVAAAGTGAQVTAVDISPAMVAAARAKGAQIPALRVVEAGLLSQEPALGPADFVYTRNALHHLPDFWKVIALERIAAMLRPGGVLLLRDLVFAAAAADVPGVIEAWLGDAARDSGAGYTAAELAEHVATEHSTFTWLLEPMLDRAGFEVMERTVRKRVYAAYVCRRR